VDHGTGLAAPPALEERAYGGPRFNRAEPVQVELAVRPCVEQRVARIERGMAGLAPPTPARRFLCRYAGAAFAITGSRSCGARFRHSFLRSSMSASSNSARMHS